MLRWGACCSSRRRTCRALGVALEALAGAPLEQRLDPRSDHLRFFTARTLAAVLRDAGFADVAIRAHGGPPGARRALTAVAR